jgi:hypothetical protein
MSSKILKLPKGFPTLFDEVMIETLCKDEVFRASVEESLGKIEKMYPDWPIGMLVYELSGGNTKYTELKDLCRKLTDMDYMKEFSN